MNIVASTVCIRNKLKPERPLAWVPTPSLTNRPSVIGKRRQLKKNGSKSTNLNYVTPQQRHDGEADQVLAQRKQVIKAANPGRWSGDIQNFSLPESVTLNPEKLPIVKELMT